MPTRWRSGCLGGVLGLVVLAPSPGRAETIRIVVEQLAFKPPRIAARVGDMIEWVNADFIVHTATERHKEWDLTIPVKGSGRIRLNAPGEIDYYCRFHPNMMGHLSVTK